jgi:hypothetical protein
LEVDTRAIAEEARRRKEAAAARAARARQRIDELRSRLVRPPGESASGRLERARARADDAHRDAELTHERSADLHEERAQDLHASGAHEEARDAEERADSERVNADIEADRLECSRDDDPAATQR